MAEEANRRGKMRETMDLTNLENSYSKKMKNASALERNMTMLNDILPGKNIRLVCLVVNKLF